MSAKNVYTSKKLESEASFMYLSVSSMKAEWLEFPKVSHLTFWILSKNGSTTKSWYIFADISDKCGDANEVQTIDNWPILQGAREKGESVLKYEKQLNVLIKLTEQKQQ